MFKYNHTVTIVEAVATSTLQESFLKNEQTQNNLENALVILLVMSVVKETSVMGDKEEHFLF